MTAGNLKRRLQPTVLFRILHSKHRKHRWCTIRLMRYALDFVLLCSWWRHQMETFSALLALCAGNSSVTGEFPAQRPVTRSLDVFFDLHLNKQLSKQSWGWCFQMPLRSLWRHCNVMWICVMCDLFSQIQYWCVLNSNISSVPMKYSAKIWIHLTVPNPKPKKTRKRKPYAYFLDVLQFGLRAVCIAFTTQLVCKIPICKWPTKTSVSWV